jgi:hypothetical protein
MQNKNLISEDVLLDKINKLEQELAYLKSQLKDKKTVKSRRNGHLLGSKAL